MHDISLPVHILYKFLNFNKYYFCSRQTNHLKTYETLIIQKRNMNKKANSGIGSGASTAGTKVRSGIGRGIGGGNAGAGQAARTSSQYAGPGGVQSN
jgi:hypothetical protein